MLHAPDKKKCSKPEYLAFLAKEATSLSQCGVEREGVFMLLCKKIKLDLSEQDMATLEFMQGKCRGRAL
ncbi:hypothetical protein Krac_7400 [Ktedonobacter racemifer DSM 44963]|uniref:Uncharacterized protein n=1 Tax=Ktedonobacter racemifer DSM 44963 TaxID=485913 RepID=D6TS50_KTERA|nr:hypothetical protein Krac_7400 [Ktedonobacter racemifer DSM 44963]